MELKKVTSKIAEDLFDEYTSKFAIGDRLTEEEKLIRNGLYALMELPKLHFKSEDCISFTVEESLRERIHILEQALALSIPSLSEYLSRI